jgi:hypothetical protein
MCVEFLIKIDWACRGQGARPCLMCVQGNRIVWLRDMSRGCRTSHIAENNNSWLWVLVYKLNWLLLLK